MLAPTNGIGTSTGLNARSVKAMLPRLYDFPVVKLASDKRMLMCEKVELDNDPRFEDAEDADDTAPPSPELQSFHLRNDDSDPDEADIEEHIGPHGFLHHRDTRSGLHHQHHDPDADPVIQRFIDMVQNFGPPRRVGAFGNEGHGGHGREEHGGGAPRPHVHRTTFTSGGTTASLTIFSGSPSRANQDGSEPDAPVDPFQS